MRIRCPWTTNAQKRPNFVADDAALCDQRLGKMVEFLTMLRKKRHRTVELGLQPCIDETPQFWVTITEILEGAVTLSKLNRQHLTETKMTLQLRGDIACQNQVR